MKYLIALALSTIVYADGCESVCTEKEFVSAELTLMRVVNYTNTDIMCNVLSRGYLVEVPTVHVAAKTTSRLIAIRNTNDSWYIDCVPEHKDY